MYNSTSINDGLQFINQANTRTNKTSNKLKNNKYKNNNKNGGGLVLEDYIIEGFAVTDINYSGINTKNKKTHLMNWAAWKIEASDFGNIRRTNKFAVDQDLENYLNRHSEIKTEINKLEEEFKSLVELGDRVNFKQLILEKKKELAAYAEYVRKLVL